MILLALTMPIAGHLAELPGIAPLISSNLPIIIIDTDGAQIEDESRISVHMGAIYYSDGSRHYIGGEFNSYDGWISIELRGNSSLGFPKKSYGFETQNDQGENLNVELLGLPAENDWILYAPYSDRTLIRNVLAFKLGWDLGHYNPRTQFCELILNGDYQGVYVLMEKIKIDKNRLDISRQREPDIAGDELTGGYIIQVNWDGEGWNSHGKRFVYHYPQSDQLQPEQKEYIRDFIEEFEDALLMDDFDKVDKHYYSYLDLNSFIDFVLIGELAKNVDVMRFSTFMYKDRDSRDDRLHMGPLWDFNLAFGNMAEGVFWDPEGWSRGNGLDPTLFWWHRINEDEHFQYYQRQRWDALRLDVFNEDVILDYIDSVAVYLDEAQQRNFNRWPIHGEYVWDNPFWGDSYVEDVEYMKEWIVDRVEWIDGHLEQGKNPEVEAASPDSALVYPNPFSTQTALKIELTDKNDLDIRIFDVMGREVNQLYQGLASKGIHNMDWAGNDWTGRELPAGLYFMRVSIGHAQPKVYKLIKL